MVKAVAVDSDGGGVAVDSDVGGVQLAAKVPV